MCFFSSQFLSEIFLILRRIERDIIVNLHTSSCKVPVFLVTFYLKVNFHEIFSRKSSNT